MTIATTASRVDYTGNGVTTAFPVPFVFFAASELRVIQRVIATGVETVLTLSTHYTVAGGNGASGTVTAVTAPPATVQWTILRNTARTQLTDFTVGDPLPADTLERGLDRITALVQENERDQARALRVAETDTFAPVLPTAQARAGLYLAFDANGVPVATPGSTSVIPTTTWSATLLLQSSATGARSHLGLGSAAVLPAGTAGAAVMAAATAAAARTAIGATATGSALVTAADAAAARTAIVAPATPSGAAGPGQWVQISVGPSSSYTLPAGGTWAFFFASYSSGAFNNAVASIAAGGTTIASTGPTNAAGGFAWRIR